MHYHEPSDRVKKLLSELSVEEKINQLSCTIPMMLMQDGEISKDKLDAQIPAGIGRMTQYATGFMSGPKAAAEGHNKIQKYMLEETGTKIPVLIQNETAAGLVAAGATVFPVPIAAASTWQPELMQQVGEVISDEARAIGVKVTMSPVADVARDSRWGRVGETFGEDPTLVTQFSVAKVKGLQGDDYRAHTISCAKHFMGYGASEGGINTAVIPLGRKELLETHGTPFAAMIQEADLQGLMVTYSEIDGLPMSINEYYMRDILRDQYGFKGVAVCDAMSIPRCYDYQGIGKNLTEIAGLALRAGVDADTPMTSAYNSIKEGLNQGLVSEADLDEAVLRVLMQKEDMGLLDQPYVDVDKVEEVFSRTTGNEVSREIARKEITLLKNEKQVLPLKQDTKKITLAGPFADRLSTLFGGYAYPSFAEMLICAAVGETTSMEGFTDFFKKMMDIEQLKKDFALDESLSFQENLDGYIRRSYGIQTLRDALVEEFPDTKINCCLGVTTDDFYKEEIEKAVADAKDSDVIVLTLGEVTGFGKDATSGEGINNPDLRLPGHQEELVKEMAKLGKPVVLILFNGRALELSSVAPLCDAILEVWYPGPYGGDAIAEVLSGKVNPGGRLPITFPQISAQCPIYYGHKSGSGYKTIKGEPDNSVMQPLYPFGHGLSYTEFELGGLEVSDSVATGAEFTVTVRVKNTGDVAGDEVVQLYSHTLQPSILRPVQELRAFKRVSLQPGEEKKVTFTLHTNQFGYYNVREQFVLEPGPVELMIGKSSDDIVMKKVVEFTGATLDIIEDRKYMFSAVEQI